jgi:hypothetical protein
MWSVVRFLVHTCGKNSLVKEESTLCVKDSPTETNIIANADENLIPISCMVTKKKYIVIGKHNLIS